MDKSSGQRDCQNCGCLFESHYRPGTTELQSKCVSCEMCKGYWPNLLRVVDPEPKRMLSNLLARIHRDGGHMEHQAGTEIAVKLAEQRVIELFHTLLPALTVDQLAQNMWDVRKLRDIFSVQYERDVFKQWAALALAGLNIKDERCSSRSSTRVSTAPSGGTA
jgi:hypothetical protein